MTTNSDIATIPTAAPNTSSGVTAPVYPHAMEFKPAKPTATQAPKSSSSTMACGKAPRRDRLKKSTPPRPMNSFMLWSAGRRPHLAAENPGLINTVLSRMLGHEWKILPAAEKDKFQAQAEAAKLEHKIKFPDYQYSPVQKQARKASKDYQKLMREVLDQGLPAVLGKTDFEAMFKQFAPMMAPHPHV